MIAGSVWNPGANQQTVSAPEVVLQPLPLTILLRALWICARRWRRISALVARVLFKGTEEPMKRAKALMHTWLGACYAVQLEEHGVDHIHVHHGYFGSWIAMVAARLLDVGFSMTLHGSDLLLHGVYLDAKLESCAFCLTVSEFNRDFILEHYAGVCADKVVVSRLGVDVPDRVGLPTPNRRPEGTPLKLLAVGRLHAVKDHAFLIRACAELYARDVPFECSIAGDGPERADLELLIQQCDLEGRVSLLGHVPREQMDSLYDRADVVVLTSKSEGIPLVLMEAMARGKIVLAPAITGIPELVIAGKTGFLFEPGSLEDFVARLILIRSSVESDHDCHPCIHSPTRQLEWVRHAAQAQVRHNFSRRKNLETFGDLFLERIGPRTESIPDENFVLQQI